MTNRLAVILGILIALFVAADLIFDWGWCVFLGKELLKLIEWAAFWR
ncbi:hypothetical protein [Tropicimonas sp. IMCC34011]|nr:hypothetical protein [Tropicimonas sp. IMCC34011]